ncbi:hypothetical protein FRC12_020203, partial [Ceratobasidium sp. 428]
MDTYLPSNTWDFILELEESVSKIQTIINHLGTVVDDLSNAKDEIMNHYRSEPAARHIDSDCEACIRDSLRALDDAAALRDKHQELALYFSQPERPTLVARMLVDDLNLISNEFFTSIATIQNSIGHIYRDVEAFGNTPVPDHWWRRALGWVRDGLATAGGILALVHGLNFVGAALSLSGMVVGAAHAHIKPRKRNKAPLEMTAHRLLAAESTLENILALQL